MNLQITIAPTSEPLTTLEAKKQCEIEASVTAHDTFIDDLIKDARVYTENYLGIGLFTQTVVQRWDRFPLINSYNRFPLINRWDRSPFFNRVDYYGELELSHGNIQQVNFLKYVDTDGILQTLTKVSKAQQTGTFTALPTAADTITINDVVYTFTASITDVKAAGTLTFAENAANTNTVTIGTHVYTFNTSLTDTADNVLIGASASASIDNLIAAIMGTSGAGTTYGTGTVTNTDVAAAVGAGDTLTATALTAGTAGNAIATTDTLAGASAWGAVVLENGETNNVNRNIKIGATATECARNITAAINLGSGAGLYYAALTEISADVRATYLAGVYTIESILETEIPNTYILSESCDNYTWAANVLAGGTGDDVDYVASIIGLPPKLTPAYSKSWPGTRTQPDMVQCEYIRGWATTAEIPSGIKRAMRMLVNSWFVCRNDSVRRYPSAVDILLDQYKNHGVI